MPWPAPTRDWIGFDGVHPDEAGRKGYTQVAGADGQRLRLSGPKPDGGTQDPASALRV